MTAPSRSRLGNVARAGKRFIGIRLALSQLGRQVGHRAHPQQLALDVFVQLIFPPHRSEEHTSELQSLRHLVCRLLLEKKISSGSGRELVPLTFVFSHPAITARNS